MSGHSEIFELVPLYALDALDASEATAVEHHLVECDVCRAELDAHREVAGSLVPDDPAPGHLWDRIESTIGASAEAVVHDLGSERMRRAKPWQWVAAVAAVALFAVGGVLVGRRLALDDLGTGDGVVAAARAAAEQPGTRVSEFFVDDVSVAQVVLTEDGVGYMIPRDTLEALGADRTYQLWVLTPDEVAISAGVLGNDPGPVAFTWRGDLAGLALTREVAGGVVSSAGDVVSVISEA